MKPVHVGVISDTHIKNFNHMPESLDLFLKKVDLVLHLGDFTSPELFEQLKSLNHFHGVAGNHDPRYIKSCLPRTDVIEINGKRLGLLHGYWSPFLSQQRSMARFRRDKVDAILYGHTHIIRNEIVHDILFFNPGSASACWPAPWMTCGILHIGDTIKGEIIALGSNTKTSLERCLDHAFTREQVLQMVCLSRRIPDYSVKL